MSKNFYIKNLLTLQNKIKNPTFKNNYDTSLNNSLSTLLFSLF